jgi:hypothetical protein
MVPRPRATTLQTFAEAAVVFLMVLQVLCTELLVSFERNSVSSYFARLLEANTVGVRDIIPLLQVLHGIPLNFTAPIVKVMFLFECKVLLFLYVFSPVTHTSPTCKGSRES